MGNEMGFRWKHDRSLTEIAGGLLSVGLNYAGATTSQLVSELSCLLVFKYGGSEDAHLVGDTEGVAVGNEPDVGLLLAIGTNEGVDAANLSSVDIRERLLDHLLIGTGVHNEGHGVLVFHLLHALLSGKG